MFMNGMTMYIVRPASPRSLAGLTLSSDDVFHDHLPPDCAWRDIHPGVHPPARLPRTHLYVPSGNPQAHS